MIDLMKIVKSSADSGLLLKGVTKATKYKTKNKEEDFLLRYKILQGVRSTKKFITRHGLIGAGNGVIRADDGIKTRKDYLQLPHPLTNLEIHREIIYQIL